MKVVLHFLSRLIAIIKKILYFTLYFFMICMIVFICVAFIGVLKQKSYCNFPQEYFSDRLYYNPSKECINKLLDKADNNDTYAISRLRFYYNNVLREDWSGLDDREKEFVKKY